MLHQPQLEYRHFSAEVRIELRASNGTFDVASIGPNEVVLRDGQDIPSGDAEIFLFVDSAEFRWNVRLPNGAVPFENEVYIVPRGKMVRVVNQLG